MGQNKAANNYTLSSTKVTAAGATAVTWTALPGTTINKVSIYPNGTTQWPGGGPALGKNGNWTANAGGAFTATFNYSVTLNSTAVGKKTIDPEIVNDPPSGW
jgi:hypothetical protein